MFLTKVMTSDYIIPEMTAPAETVVNEETGEVEQVIEHYHQGDHYYRIIHDYTQSVVDESEEQIPYRTFSKLSIESRLFEAGVLNAVDAFIDSQTVTNEFGQTAPLRRFYNTALTFRENHPLFSQYVSAVKNVLGWTDEQVEGLLSKCIAER